MPYRIEYYHGYCHNYANNREDLFRWLDLLKDEEIIDILKIRKDGSSVSVFGKYKKYIKGERRK